MVTCRYVGGDEFEVGDREFSRIGEVAVFGEDVFRDAVLGGCPLIPESDFRKIGFTQEELDAYGALEDRDDCDGAFAAKLAEAQQSYRDLQRLFKSGDVARVMIAEVSDNFVSDYGDLACHDRA